MIWDMLQNKKKPSFCIVSYLCPCFAAQHGLQATPLARPVTRGVFRTRPMPSRGAIYERCQRRA